MWYRCSANAGACAIALGVALPAMADGPTRPATAQPADASDNDPLESVNRFVFELNGVFYEVTSPIVRAAPDPVKGFFKALGTLATAPIRIISTFADDDDKAESLADVARKHDIDCGFYVVLPFIGPSNERDAIGDLASIAANSATSVVVLGAGSAVSERIEGEQRLRLLEGSIDEYALARSAKQQERGCLVVKDGDAPSGFN